MTAEHWDREKREKRTLIMGAISSMSTMNKNGKFISTDWICNVFKKELKREKKLTTQKENTCPRGEEKER